MSFSVPQKLPDQILHWWKIIDRPKVNKDWLTNFIAFDLFLCTFEDSKKKIETAIEEGLLLLDSKTEEITLSAPLAKFFDAWQQKGEEKLEQMQKISAISWRAPMEIPDPMKYAVYMSAFADGSTKQQAAKIRSSRISLTTIDLSKQIEGIAIEVDEEGNKTEYPFKIDIQKKQISHACPEFQETKAKKKQFCPHLTRMFQKLYAQEDIASLTLELLHNLVKSQQSWQFS